MTDKDRKQQVLLICVDIDGENSCRHLFEDESLRQYDLHVQEHTTINLADAESGVDGFNSSAAVILETGSSSKKGRKKVEHLISQLGGYPVLVLAAGLDVEFERFALQLGAQDCLDAADLDAPSLATAIRKATFRGNYDPHMTDSECIVKMSSDPLLVLDRDGYVQELNPAAAEFFEKRVEQMTGTLFGFPAQDGEITEIEVLNAGSGNRFAEMRSRNITSRGKDLILINLRDITDRKQVEQALRESEELHRVTLESISDAIFLTDEQGDFVFVCPNISNIFGYTEAQAWELGSIWKLLGPQFYDELELEKCGELKNLEHEISNANGEERVLLVNVKSVSIMGGSTLISCRDITKRKEAELELERSEGNYRLLVENMNEGLAWVDTKGDLQYVNTRLCDMLGYAVEDMLGARATSFVSPVDIPLLESKMAAMADDPRESYELNLLSSDGMEVLVLVSPKTTFDDDGNVTGAFAVLTDISAIRQAENMLRSSEQKFRGLYEKMSQGVIYQDANGNTVSVNPAAESILGLSSDEMLGSGSLDPRWKIVDENGNEMPKDDLPPVITLKTGKTIEGVITGHMNPKTKKLVWVLTNSYPQFDKDAGSVKGIIITFEDITEIKNARDELQKTHRALNAMYGSISLISEVDSRQDIFDGVCDILVEQQGYALAWIGLMDHDKDKKIRPVARAGDHDGFLDKFNVTWGEVDGGLTPAGLAVHNGEPVPCRRIDQCQVGGEWREHALKQGFTSGVVVPLLDDSTAFGALFLYSTEPDAFDEDEVRLLRALADDLSRGLKALAEKAERQQVQEELRKERNLLERIMRASPNGILMLGTDKKIYYANRKAESLLRLQQAEAGDGRYETPEVQFMDMNNHKIPADKSPVSMVLQTARPVKNFDHRICFADGTMITVSMNAEPMLDSEDNLEGVVVTVQDITEQRKIEQELIKSREAYRDLFDEAPVGYHELDRQGRINRINLTEARMLGYDRIEMLGRLIFDFVDPEDRERVQKKFKERMEGRGKFVSYERKYARKDGRILIVRIDEVPVLDERGEITGVRTSIQNITEQKKAWEIVDRLATAVDQSINIIVMTDQDGKIEYVNPAFEKVTGYSREEVLGLTPRVLKSGRHGAEFYRDLWTTITSGRVWAGRIVNRKKDGSLYHEEMSISPVRDENDNIVNYVAVQNDITQQVELEEQLRHAQKMESIGLLAGGVAHDFNNILTSIIGYSSLLGRSKNLPEKTLRRLSEIEKAAHRGAEITKQLLTFSRSTETEQKVVDVQEIVAQTLRMLKRTIGSNIRIKTEYESEKMLVHGDSTQIQQIVMNLCINAKGAMPDGGEIVVACRRLGAGEFEQMRNLLDPDGTYMELRISDTGCGMSEETMEHIFEPFFTTREVGEGTGLGLSIVYGIVKNHKGTISVESELNEGTTFKVCLPLTSTIIGEESEEGVKVRGGDETVMIVDDNEMVLRLAAAILEEYGYCCRKFLDPLEALDYFNANPGEVDLALLDVVMPGMSGLELFKEMRKSRPDLPALISSGYSMQNREEIMDMGVGGLVPKPYEEEKLARAVRELLDESDGGDSD